MPNNEYGNLAGVHVALGDRVQLISPLPQQYRINTNDRFDLEAGELFEVTRVQSSVLNVRTIGTKTVREVRNYTNRRVERRVSFMLNRAYLAFEDPNYMPPPPPRKLGQVPDREDLPNLDPDVPIIGVDHPGIQWLFDDMGTFAEKEGYCNHYDVLCARLGIPGRPRDFTVKRMINGLSINTTVKARSQAEASDLVDTALGLKSESETTPSEPEPQAA